MAQCFVSTYRNHYRWQQPTFTPNWKPYDKFVEAIPPEDIWIIDKIGEETLEAEVEKLLQKCLQERMTSTYQLHYCKKIPPKTIGEAPSFENQLLEYCKQLYEPDSRPKIAPPLPGTRKVFGYIRPTRNYTRLTTYQYCFGQVAYNILKEEKKPLKDLESPLVFSKALEKAEKHKESGICDCICCQKP